MSKSTKFLSFNDGYVPSQLDIDQVYFNFDKDSCILILSNADIIKFKLSEYFTKDLSNEEINDYDLIDKNSCISWKDKKLHLVDLLNDAADNYTLKRLDEALKDGRENKDKIIVGAFYVNCEGKSRQEYEKNIALIYKNVINPMKEKYEKMILSLDFFVVPVLGDQETKIQFFAI